MVLRAIIGRSLMEWRLFCSIEYYLFTRLIRIGFPDPGPGFISGQNKIWYPQHVLRSLSRRNSWDCSLDHGKCLKLNLTTAQTMSADDLPATEYWLQLREGTGFGHFPTRYSRQWKWMKNLSSVTFPLTNRQAYISRSPAGPRPRWR